MLDLIPSLFMIVVAVLVIGTALGIAVGAIVIRAISSMADLNRDM